ncbi:sugar ABC transporter permease [Curtobacterium sp. MCBD17_034]|uniref:carbohydrate ABC transporter permease n=1 Tax=unclassified Curtobacterium TaxID=257496 RepID=UPI000DA77ADC|nr:MULTISPECIES: sugar ABC transporter permease [unclassified Curtobacterium]PZF56579.1 sugar ABC transporter permease [Curtobacterium sp. MCBD17_034]PZM33763.1 sugar ABC transporter permease [Curtobacterium sp. MCBD17_031]
MAVTNVLRPERAGRSDEMGQRGRGPRGTGRGGGPGRDRGRGRAGGSARLRRWEWVSGYTFVAPTVLLFAAFVGWPILYAAYLSLTRWSGFGIPQFIGLDNYTRMANDPVARHAFVVTVLYAIVTTVLQTAIPLVIAVLVANVWKGLSVVVRTILFVPGLVSFVVSGALWKLIYDPNIGTLNRTLRGLGLGSLAANWLSTPSLVLPAIIAVSLWMAIGMNMLIFFAGIQGIDPSLYEAAEVDGASRFQQFRFVTIPGLRIVTAIVISLNLMNGFKVFDIIFVMTGGGPSHQSEVFGTYLYSLAFGSTGGSVPQLGYGSAFSVVVMLLCGVAVLVQIVLARRAAR